MKTYKGRRTADEVNVRVYGPLVNGKLLEPRFDLRNHSPTGFEWGYSGSGPAQLALALLADATNDQVAQIWYQQFKREVIAALGGHQWTMTSDAISKWVFRKIESLDQIVRQS